jgi:hypothetical protein
MPFVRGYLEFLPASGGHPEHPWIPPGEQQPPSGGHPSHPIYWPGAHPEHPWVPPSQGGQPPSGGYPSHPIYWPGAHPEHPWVPPSQGSGEPPLHPSHPIVNYPSHPIVLPPGETPPEPGNGLSPTHPIVIPPSTPGEGGGQKALVYAIVPAVGGVWFLIELPVQPPPTEAQPKRGE